MTSYLPLILGMMAVTYVPRLLPLISLTDRPLHPLIRRFLLYIPYTALSALIVRGIMEATPEMQFATLIGITTAGLFAWSGRGLVLSVFASIVASLLVVL